MKKTLGTVVLFVFFFIGLATWIKYANENATNRLRNEQLVNPGYLTREDLVDYYDITCVSRVPSEGDGFENLQNHKDGE